MSPAAFFTQQTLQIIRFYPIASTAKPHSQTKNTGTLSKMANTQVSQLLIQIYIHIPTPVIQCCSSKYHNSHHNELNSYQHCSEGKGGGGVVRTRDNFQKCCDLLCLSQQICLRLQYRCKLSSNVFNNEVVIQLY